MLRLISFFLFTAIIAVISLFFIAQSRLPSLDGVINMAELSKGASVKFDERQVPYIEAANELDLYRVQGYITASHRLFQMDMQRRIALGELSEVYGAQSLTQDKLMRTIGINRAAREELKSLPKDVVTVLDCYSQGVNSYMQSNKDRLPMEFFMLGYSPRPWTPLDTLAILKYSQYEQDETWRLDDLRQRILNKAGAKPASELFERQFAAPPTVGFKPAYASPLTGAVAQALAPAPLTGSNGLVLAGSMTDTKGAILALDKHHRYGLPCDWYLVSLRCPELHLAGGTIPGVPGVLNGRNDKVGFGLLSCKLDVQDLFLEQFSPQFPGKYKTATGWDTASEIIEEIPVRFSDKLFFTSNLMHKVGQTKHGPMLFKNDESAVTLSWVGLSTPGKQQAGYMETLLGLNRADSIAQMQAALAKYSGSPLTALFVDKAGSCGFQQAGAIPLRAKTAAFGEHEGCLLTPGWTGTGDWIATMPFAQLAHGLNPAPGFFVANFQEFRPDMPLNTNLYRGQREKAVLDGFAANRTNKPGLPDMAVLQGDNHGALVNLVKTTLHEAINKSDLIDSYQLNALDALDKWDGAVSDNSTGAALYECFVRTVVRRALAPSLGAPLTNEYLERYPGWTKFVENVLQTKAANWLPPEERTFKNFVITSFVQSIKDMRLATGSDDSNKWHWGDVHRGNFAHFVLQIFPQAEPVLAPLLSVSNVRLSGDQDTVNTTESSINRGKDQFVSSQGSTMRLLLDMSDDEKFYQTLVLGQSAHLFAGARGDQLRSWLALKPLPLAFNQDAEAKLCQHRLLFTDR